MARPPRQRALSIFLLKESVESPLAAIRDPTAVSIVEVSTASGVEGVLALGPIAAKTPWWVGYVSPHVQSREELARLANSSTAALLLIEAGGRHFALAFGYGRHILAPNSYEQDFGLKVVVNTVEPDRLTSVDARTFDELTMHTRRDVSQGSSFSAFGLDVTRDLVRAVTGSPRDESLGRRASGSDALALVTRAQFTDLPALCRRLADAYADDAYKDRFGWIDHLRRVRDSSVVARLNEQLVESIRSDQLIDMHLAPPETLPWARLDGFTFSTRDTQELDTDPRITAYLETAGSVADMTLEKLKGDRVLAISGETGEPLDAWSVFNCLVFETRDGDVLYALTAGEWYRVSEAFVEDVYEFVNGLTRLDLPFPAAPAGIREEDYNESSAAALGALLLDQRLVPTAAGDRIELCDLLTRDRQLIHLKKRGSSSTLSHLFSQGLVSAELLVRDAGFRQAAHEVAAGLGGGFDVLLPVDAPDRDEWEVGYVVLTRSARDTPLTLPFFSLVNLRSATLRLQDLGFRVSVLEVAEG